jgi:hypothetical protein
MGRPPLTDEQLRAKVVAYCERHGVSPVPANGVPPFPSGQRETPQHREWLTVYRAHQRMKARASSDAPTTTSAGGLDATCPLCTRAVSPEEAVPFARIGRRRRWRHLHGACADLLRTAESVGPDTVARLSELLWPRHGRADS